MRTEQTRGQWVGAGEPLDRMALGLVGLVALVCASWAGAVEFRNLGPGGGGTAGTLAVDPTRPEIAYIGLDCGGMHMTRDGGESWTNANTGIDNDGHVNWNNHYASLVLPSGRVIVTSETGGIFVSDDHGATWRRVHSAPCGVGFLYLDPHDANVVYAATGQGSRQRRLSLGDVKETATRWRWQGTILVSRSGGDKGSWVRVNPATERNIHHNAAIYSLAIDHHDRTLMYAATNYGMYRSRDSGRSWDYVQHSLKRAVPKMLVTVPGKPNVVYVSVGSLGADASDMRPGVYRSLDRGETWKPVCRGLREDHKQFYALTADPNYPNVMYLGAWDWRGGLYRSVDGGRNWSILFDVNTLLNDPEPGGERNWIWHPERLHTTVGAAIRVAGKDRDGDGLTDHIYFIGDNTGVAWHSTDGGRNWQQITSRRKVIAGRSYYSGRGEMQLACARKLIVDPRNENHLWMSDFDWGLWESVDRGESFRLAWGPWYQGELLGAGEDVILDPEDPNLIYQGSWGVLRRLPGDDMRIWAGRPAFGHNLPSAVVRSLAMVHGQDDEGAYKYLYAAVRDHGVFRLDLATGEKEWEDVSAGLPRQEGKADVWVLAQIPGTRKLYAGMKAGILRSDDGRTWTRITGPGTAHEDVVFARNLAVDPKRPGWLYASVMKMFHHQPMDGLYLSEDYGQTWTKLAYLELPFGVTPDPSGSQPAAFVASQTHGVYRVARDAKTGEWAAKIFADKRNGLDHTRCWSVTVDPHNPKRVYVATHGGALYVGERE